MQKIFLHIGMHKTGTTAFQSFCASHTTELRRQGFFYPQTGRPRAKDISYGHHLLPWSLTRHFTSPEFWPTDLNELPEIWDHLRAEIVASACPNIIITSEEFDTLNDDQVRFVCATLDGFDLHPIIYLRKLDEFVQGMYSTDVIFNGEVGTIADYLTRVRTPLDYKKIIDPWARYADRLPAVRFYSPLLSKHANIVDDIAANMGLALTGLSPNVFERVNVGSWPWYVVEVSRQMNQCGTPSDLVVKFAFIIREIAGPEAHYSLMLPSNATLLNQAGLESAERLQEVGLISWVPSFLRENSVVDTDENWLDTHAAEHAALTCVLQQMSNVVGQQIS